jgi:hypothetical protein
MHTPQGIDMDVITDLMATVPAWISAISMLVAGAAAIAALTPTQKDDRIIAKVMACINVLALNLGNAKNKRD